MSLPVITLKTFPPQQQPDSCFTYQIAGCLLVSDRLFPALYPFRSDYTAQPVLDTEPFRSAMIAPDTKPIFNGSAWLGSADRQLECRSLSDGYRLSVDQLGVFTVRCSGRNSLICFYACGTNEQLLEEVILGPPLMLALAQQKIFCLHASAALINDRAYAFTGDSGKGKSTLAAYLGANGHPRIADDILPISIDNDQIAVHGHFPQLKITANQQPGALLAEKLPLSALFILDQGETTTIQREDSKTAFLSIIHQTVAVRLFNPTLTASHMAFCQRITGLLATTTRLIYPRKLNRLNEVKSLLETIEP